MWARFVARQDLPTVLRCHVAAFEALGGAPEQILYDRMKTASSARSTRAGHRLQRQAPGPGRALRLRCPRRAGPTGPRPRARWSGPSATSARTSSSPAPSATSTTSTPSSGSGWTRSPTPRARHHRPRRRRALRRGAAALKALPAGPFNAVLALERRITARGHGLGRRQSLLRARQHPPARRRGPDHRRPRSTSWRTAG